MLIPVHLLEQRRSGEPMTQGAATPRLHVLIGRGCAPGSNCAPRTVRDGVEIVNTVFADDCAELNRPSSASLLPHVETDGDEDDCPGNGLLSIGIHAEQHHAILEYANDGSAENRAEHSSLAAYQTGAADDGRGDDRQF